MYLVPLRKSGVTQATWGANPGQRREAGTGGWGIGRGGAMREEAGGGAMREERRGVGRERVNGRGG
jgi:hypothetical protein